MAGETLITVVGNLTADPGLRFTSSGAVVVYFTVASTPRTFDRQAGEWKDGDALFGSLPKVRTQPHTCSACRRIWRPRNDGHGAYWHWNGHEKAKANAAAKPVGARRGGT